ncbi:MAG: tetratricopeptide repeat protein, partial [Pseudomonadota bacterium]
MTADPLAAAERAYRQGDSQAADRLAADSSRPEALQFRAMLAMQAGSLEAASGFLATYLEARPQDANGWHNLALVASQQGSLEKAADAWQQALKLKPDHP